MSRDLEHLLNATAAEPSRPVDPAEIARLARRRRRRRQTGTAVLAATAVAGLITIAVLPSSGGTDDTVAPSATNPDPVGVPPDPAENDSPPSAVFPERDVQPYAPGYDCPVTKPSTPGFEPAEGYPADPSSASGVWFGTDALWTVLPVNGEYDQRKSVWWSTEFPGGTQEPRPNVSVAWERLDLRGRPITTVITNGGRGTNARGEDGWFMIAGVDPAEPGCWQVTAEYKGAELSYIYEITEVALQAGPDAGRTSEPVAGSDDVRPADLALGDVFTTLATDPSPETAASMPFAETVALGLGPELYVERAPDELGDPEAWRIDREHFRAHAGPFSALELLRQHVTSEPDGALRLTNGTKVEVGDYIYCAGSPLPPSADAVEHLRRVSIQAADESVTSWLGLFYVDLYVDEDGFIHAVTLDLCDP